MTIFDFTKDDQGDWFSFFGSKFDTVTGEVVYDLPEKGAAEFRIRLMSPFWEERRKGKKREHKMVHNPVTRAMERVSYFPDLPADEAEKENADAWDYAITDIKNAFDANGTAIECTRENKLKLIEMPVFLRFVGRVFQIMADAGIKEKEEQEKN